MPEVPARKTFIGNSLITIFGTAFTGIFNYLFHFFISRKMSVGQYGELQSLLAVFTIFSVFTMALTNFVIKYASVFKNTTDYPAVHSFVADLVPAVNKFLFWLGILLVAASYPLSLYLHLTSYWGLFFTILGVLFALPAALYSALLNSWEHFFPMAILQSLGTVLKFAVGVGVVFVLPQAWLVALSLLVSSIGSLALGIYLLHKHFPKTTAPVNGLWKEKHFPGGQVRKTVVPIFVFSFLVVVLGNIDVLWVKNLTTAEFTGLYGAFKTLGTVLLAVNMAVILTLLPRVASEADSKRTLLESYGIITIINAGGVLLFYLFPSLFLGLLFGSKYVVLTESLWLFGIAVSMLSYLMLESHIAYGRHKYSISYVLIGTVGVMALAIHYFHADMRQIVLGVAASFAVGYLAALMLNYKKPLPHG